MSRDPEDRSRRTVLRGIGAGALAGVAAGTGRGDPRDGPDRIGSVSSPGSGKLPDPIPESVTVTAGGTSHEVPVERKVVRGTCDDVTRMGKSNELLADGQGAGETNGYWTINGTDAWPLFGTEISPGARRLKTEGAGDGRRLGYAVGEEFEVRKHQDLGDTGSTWRLASHSLDLGANPSIRVLDWHPSHRLSDDCRAFWCDAIDQILEHEKVHVGHALEIAADLDDKLESPGESPDDLGGPGEPLQVRIREEVDDPAAVATERLGRELQALLYRYLSRGVRRLRDRSGEFHGTPAGAGVGWNCEPCKECGDHEYRPITKVRRWTLDVDYAYSATVDRGQIYRSVDQFATASYDLARERLVPVVDDVHAFFGDVANGVGSVYNDLFEGGADDPVPNFGPRPFWSGPGEFSATVNRESRLRDEDGELVRRTVVDAAGGGATQSDSTLLLGRDRNRYRISLGNLGEVEGRATTTGPGGTTVSDVRAIAWSGTLAQLQADGRGPDPTPISGDDSGDGANGTGVPDVDFGAIRSMASGEPPWQPVPDCRKVLTHSIDQELYGSQYVQRMHLWPGSVDDGEGIPVGRERLRWRLGPADGDGDGGPGHVNCP